MDMKVCGVESYEFVRNALAEAEDCKSEDVLIQTLNLLHEEIYEDLIETGMH
jgi:hypothetical protein